MWYKEEDNHLYTHVIMCVCGGEPADLDNFTGNLHQNFQEKDNPNFIKKKKNLLENKK